MANNPWVITPLEFSQFETQFFSMFPQNGFLSGNQVRELFMKSGLSAQILAQIWALSDVNRDGQMDRYEFAIAMTLIRRCMSGLQLPPTLPPSLRSVIPLPGQPPAIMSRSPSGPPIMPPSIPPGPSGPLKQCSDWSLPLPSKNKYRQQFYSNDKQSVGLLNGNQARYILSQSGLPTPILADIWNLSDVNKDGCLSPDEFCVAMHLIDMYKMGYALPKELPPELLDLFPNARRQSNDSPSIGGAKKSTFDDKFMDSYQRGQAELERRRQIAREEEERLRAEAERREQEERDRKERERQEIERRREAEREAERQRELEREKARQEEEQRLLAEREAIRKKLEDERMKELEKIRIRELENQKESEAEKTAQMQQRLKNMTFQLQALQEKSDSLNDEVTKARDEIIAITSEIEGMRSQRDEKLATMNQMQQHHQQLSIQCERVSHEHLQLQSECRISQNRADEIEQLKKVIIERNEEIAKITEESKGIRERLETQQTLNADHRPEFEKSNKEFAQLIEEYNEMARRAIARQEELRRKAAEKARNSFLQKQASFPTTNNFATNFGSSAGSFEDAFSSKLNVTSPTKTETSAFVASNVAPIPSSEAAPVNNGFEDSFTATPQVTTTTPAAASKYRALFEFNARSDDELSIQPGDEILVFESQSGSEPGWLAGQIRGKVGWFPASFAEPINTAKKQSIPSIVTSPFSEPLASIKEEPNERENDGFNTGPTATYDAPPALSLYEQPPIEEHVTSPVKETSAVTTTTTVLPAYDAPPGDVPAVNENEKVIAVGTALYRWNAQKDGDLSFSKGDEIEILEQAEMKWRGRLTKNRGVQGWFPKSYVKLSDKSPKQSPTSPTKPTAQKEDGEWYVALWGFEAVEPSDLTIKPGDRIWVIEQQEQWWKGVLNGQTGIFPATYVEKAASADQKHANAIPTETVKDSIARALVDFEATADNQISLKAGDLVKIRSTSPAGWWEGEIQLPNGENKTGWFPGNYVELVTQNNAQSNGHSTPVS